MRVPVSARAGLNFTVAGSDPPHITERSKGRTHSFRAGENGGVGRAGWYFAVFFLCNSFFVVYLLLLILLLLLSFSYLIVLAGKLFLSRPVISAFCLPWIRGKGSTIWLGRLSVEREVTNPGNAAPNPPLGVFRGGTELKRKALDRIKDKAQPQSSLGSCSSRCRYEHRRRKEISEGASGDCRGYSCKRTHSRTLKESL